MTNATLERLEAQIGELLLMYQHLQLENDALRKKESHLASECKQLSDKNQIAAKKVEQLLEKLNISEKLS